MKVRNKDIAITQIESNWDPVGEMYGRSTSHYGGKWNVRSE